MTAEERFCRALPILRRHLVQLGKGLVGNHARLRAFLLRADQRVDRLRHSIARTLPQIILPRVQHLNIAITANCNLRCRGCRYGRDFMAGKQLDADAVCELLADAKAIGVGTLNLYGGEPLLHPDLPRFVHRASQLGLRAYVTTNGILLRQHIQRLYDAGLRELAVGLYGTGDTYDRYVQVKGAFARLCDGLAMLRDQCGMSVALYLKWLLMRPTCNPREMENAWELAEKYRAYFRVDLFHYSLPYFNNDPACQFAPDDRPRIEEVVRQLLLLRARHPDVVLQSSAGLASITDWLIKKASMPVPCDKYSMLWVGADGTVQVCYAAFKLGNIYSHRLQDLVFTPEHRGAARDCFALQCPKCHCGYDERIWKDGASYRRYQSQVDAFRDSLRSARGPDPGCPTGGEPSCGHQISSS